MQLVGFSFSFFIVTLIDHKKINTKIKEKDNN